jgi:hypothetical protein
MNVARKKAITLREHALRIAGLGGKASMENRTAEERSQFARMGGRVGGKRAAAKLTQKQRQERARKAAQARWGKKEK